MSKDLLSQKINPDNGAGNGKIFALFQNIQDKGAPLTWAWQGQIYTYEDGQVYLMTREQIDHLNSLTVTVHKQEMSPDGQLQSKPISQTHRFSVREIAPAEVAKMQAAMAPAAA